MRRAIFVWANYLRTHQFDAASCLFSLVSCCFVGQFCFRYFYKCQIIYMISSGVIHCKSSVRMCVFFSSLIRCDPFRISARIELPCKPINFQIYLHFGGQMVCVFTWLLHEHRHILIPYRMVKLFMTTIYFYSVSFSFGCTAIWNGEQCYRFFVVTEWLSFWHFYFVSFSLSATRKLLSKM